MTDAPIVRITGGQFDVAGRTLWSDLNLEVAPGEFIVILGSNGSGKTSLLRTVLGERTLSSGSMENSANTIGYVPQHYVNAEAAPVRARDLISLAVDGHRLGIPWVSREREARVTEVLDEVGLTECSHQPLPTLSGGQQQRIRIGQALVGNPDLLLCDEPFGSLDPASQHGIAQLINRRRTERGTAVMLVTHDINPIASMTDRVLYLAGGGYRIGTVNEVLRSDVLTELYGTPIEVIRVGGRIVVVGTSEDPHEHGREHHHGQDHAHE